MMLNPSIADADLDDPTIRRCLSFAKREGAGGIEVVNVYAFRATEPCEMLSANDPYGPENERVLTDLACRSQSALVCAWGTQGGEGALRVMQLFRQFGVPLVCLGITKDGHPRHPLYVSGNQPLVPFA